MTKVKRIAIAALALGALLLPATAANAAQGAPAWRLQITATPTNLAPGSTGSAFGPVYTLVATNIGGADAAGPATLSATFPAGVKPLFDTTYPQGKNTTDSSVPAPTCSKVPSQTVTCTVSVVHPGRPTWVRIPVEVSSTLQVGEVLPDVVASVSGPGTTLVTTSIPTRIDTEPPPFGFLPGAQGFSTLFTETDGSPSFAAGSHPDQLIVSLGLPSEQPVESGPTTGAGHPRDIVTDLPPGVVINPNAAATCTEAELLEENCPRASQVGLVTLLDDITGPMPEFGGVFNMQAPPGTPAMLAFEAAALSKAGVFVHLTGGVRSNGDYGLFSDAPDILARALTPVEGIQIQLWGDPTSHRHDQVRDPCRAVPNLTPCGTEERDTAFITMPSACTGPLVSSIHTRSWEEAAEGVTDLPHEATAQSTDLEGNPIGVSGCSQEEFEPAISSQPTTNLADSPSGLDIALHQPQNQRLGQIAPANLKDATVNLPAGMAVNPAQADGLDVCSTSQIGYLGNGHYSAAPDNCPDAAKIGSMEVVTPLLDHPIPGSVFIAKPFDNQFGSLLAIYLSIDDPADGLYAKLPGRVTLDPVTGQLSTRFEENPQLPLEEVKLHLFGGARGALITPPTCGKFTTTSDLTPWSTPEGADAHPTDSFVTTGAPSGVGGCPASESAMPNSPTFSAGTITPQAGAYSPFVLRISREDGSQRLTGIDTTLAPGLLGKLAGIGECSEAQIARAASRSHPEEGKLERDNPSCPASTQVGTVDAAAGAGPTPYHASGTAYLAGPYKGAPLSLALIVPAVAGPFDLGTVVTRVALHVEPETTQIHAVSDPVPTILDGIPLDVRSVALKMDRPQFTLNPTSCNPLAITGTVLSSLGQSAALNQRFQVGGCSALPFKPKLALRLKGSVKRSSNPKLIANLTARPGEANVARAQVKLPRAVFLAQSHIRTVCTRVQWAADTCPAGSVYGSVEATTPLVSYPLTGSVYLRSSSHKLPDLVAKLRGPASQPIEIDLVGKTDAVKGALRNTFEAVPDAPVSTFHLELFGGKRGLVEMSSGFCASRKADVQLDGQNGKAYDTRPVVAAKCPKHRKAKKHRRHGHHRGGHGSR